MPFGRISVPIGEALAGGEGDVDRARLRPRHAVARCDHPDEHMRRVLAFFDRHLRGVKRPGRCRAPKTAYPASGPGPCTISVQ